MIQHIIRMVLVCKLVKKMTLEVVWYGFDNLKQFPSIVVIRELLGNFAYCAEN